MTTSTITSPDVALLAPVPSCYLPEARQLCATVGKAAFGSRSWEVFRELDAIRKGMPVEILIYASGDGAPHGASATWRATYVGHVEGRHGAHPAGMKFRPPSTGNHPDDNHGTWAVFWEVESAAPLAPEQYMRIHDLRGLRKRKYFEKAFVPRGPLLIDPL